MRRVLLIRHGIAETLEAAAAAGRREGERRLTPDGRKKMRIAARGLRVVIEDLGTLASSPLTRARETAAVIGGAFGRDVEILDCLAPGLDRAVALNWRGLR